MLPHRKYVQYIGLLLGLVLGVPHTGFAAFSQAFNNGGPVSGISTTINMTGITAGCTGVAFVTMKSESRTISTFVDSTGDTWTAATGDQSNAGNGERLATWKSENLSAGSHTLTITFDSSAQSGSTAVALEYCGTTNPAVDQSVSAQLSTAGTNWNVGPTGTLAQADEYVITMASSTTASRPLTTPSTYTSRVSLLSTQFVVADKTVSSTSAITVNWAVTGGNTFGESSIVTLKISGAGGTCTNRLNLLGVGNGC